MARPKSEDKPKAILSAAIEVFAERGLGAATSVVTSTAGVAEGTLFTYFKTKDELINAVYRAIKLDLADAMMSGFPRRASVRDRFHHVWNMYVDWGVANPAHQTVLAQIRVWRGLTPESKAAGLGPFLKIDAMAEDAVKQRILQDLPRLYMAATLEAMAETTMDFMRQEPDNAQLYRTSGFEMFWAGIARKK